MGVTNFGVGLVGAGKIAQPIKAAQRLKQGGVKGRVVYETGISATAGAVVLDPHEDRLANLVEQYPELSNPITQFLAANPEDSAAMGRFKNALEGIGLDLALVGTLAGSVRLLKALRSGEADEIASATRELDAASVEAPTSPTAAPRAEVDVPEPTLSLPDRAPDIPTGPNIQRAASEASEIPARPRVEEPTPAVRPEEVDVDAIVAGVRADEAAIAKYGSRAAAQEAGHKFGAANVPWQKIRTTGDVETLIANTAQSLRSQMDAKKGGAVLTDARVQENIESAARLFNEDPQILLGEISRAGDQATNLVANMESAFVIARKMFEDVYEAASKVNTGNWREVAESPELAQAEVKRRLTAAADVMSSGLSMRAAAGRSMRQLRGNNAIRPEDVEAFNALPPDLAVSRIAQTGGDLDKLKEAVKPEFWRRITDEATFLLTNNLLWNYPTHLVNTTTNLYMLMARPTEKLIGSIFQGTRGGAIRKQAMLEYRYMLAGVGDSLQAMSEAFMKGDSLLAPHTDEHFLQGSRVNASQIGWKPVREIFDVAHNALLAANFKELAAAGGQAAEGVYRTGVGLPTRALGGVDELIKQMRYRAIIQARAASEASDRGLQGETAKRYIKDQLELAFDVDGRGVDRAALEEANIATFQQELIPGTLGHAIQNARHSFPAIALVLPYVKTPINVLRYSVKLTPGLNLLQQEYRQMLRGAKGAEAQANAVGQFAMGSMFMLYAGFLAEQGRLTGGGPSDPKLRAQLASTGWKPYSYVIDNEDGTKTFVPIGRFDPVGTPFGLVADLIDMASLNPDSREAKKSAGVVALALARAFGEKTFLQNINSVVRAMAEPEANMSRFAGGLVGNLVPGSSALRNYVNSDPYLREARTFVDHMQKNMPEYSENLPPRRDPLGVPVWRRRGLTSSTEVDVVTEEHNRIIIETGFGIRPPSPSRNGADLRDIKLSNGRTAYDVFQERAAGDGKRTLRSDLEKLITSKGYAKLVDGPTEVKGTKLHAFAGIVRKHRERAYRSLLRDFPEVRAETMKRQTDVRSRLKDQREAQEPKKSNAQEILDSLKAMGY